MKIKKIAAGLLAFALVLGTAALPASKTALGFENAIVASAADAVTSSDGNWTYNAYEYSDGTKTATIKAYNGSDTELTIPSTIDGYTVNSISELGSNENVTSVTIPASVTYVAHLAFYKCPNLVSITVDSDNDDYTSVDGVLYNKDVTELVSCPPAKASVTIPGTVTTIEGCAFYYCTNLTSVIIPDSITEVGSDAFSETALLDNQTTAVKYVGNWVIDCDYDVEMLEVKDGTVGIGDFALWGEDATNITLPSSLKYIGAFGVAHQGITEIVIPDSVVSIGNDAFYDCKNLKTVTIPDSVTSIGWDAFYNTAMTSVTIPASVTEIDDHAFGYVWNSETSSAELVDGYIIYGYVGTAAETYANDNGITFVDLSDGTSSEDSSSDTSSEDSSSDTSSEDSSDTSSDDSSSETSSEDSSEVESGEDGTDSDSTNDATTNLDSASSTDTSSQTGSSNGSSSNGSSSTSSSNNSSDSNPSTGVGALGVTAAVTLAGLAVVANKKKK